MSTVQARKRTVVYLKYSVIRIAGLRLTTFAILMGGFFFSPCYCIPIDAPITVSEPWWCGPCKIEHKTRHSRGITNPPRDQFAIAISSYENIISHYVQRLHNKLNIETLAKKQIRKNNWLPRKKFFKTLRKDDEQILPELHFQVQIYAVTIQRLLDMEIPSFDVSFDFSHRIAMLELVKSNINLLRCEIEMEIREQQLNAPAKISATYADKKIPTAVQHLQDGLLKDYSILKDYYNFVKKCYNKIFGRKRKGNGRNRQQLKENKQKNKNKRTAKNRLNKTSEKS